MPLYEQLAGVAALVVLAVGLGGWLYALGRWRAGQPLVPLSAREPVPWTVVDLLVVILVYLAAQVAGVLVLRRYFSFEFSALEEATSEQLFMLLLVQAVANLATAALGVALTGLRVRATPRDFGLSLRDLGSDVALGAAAFCMLAPPVLAMQGVLTKWFPSEHPLVVMLREKMTGPLFVVGVFVAVIVAPVVEEFVFRVLLQGWMERLGRPKQLPPRISPEYFLNPPPSMPATSMVTAELVSEGAANPYAVPQQDAVPAKENPIAEPPPRWPIFVSAVIFALMHAGNGPDPIPLFFLALGLGYLYRQTHRITPSMTVHFLLNAASMTLLWMELTFGGK